MTDYIKRENAIATVERMYEVCTTADINDYRDLLLACFEDLPSADVVERKSGEWLWDDGYFCSECHKAAFSQRFTMLIDDPMYFRTDFCPNCGADMRKE